VIASNRIAPVRIASAGHVAFALAMIALGFLGLSKGDFPPLWAPVPEFVPAREVLVYLCAIVSLACGVGLLWRRTAVVAARVLLAWSLFWLLLNKLPAAFPAPKEIGSWYGCAELGAMVAGAWVLATGDKGVRIARVLYGVALIFFGAGHFAYVKQTVVLVPTWLPGSIFWAYFTGATFIVGGLAMIVGLFARLAAALATLQMGLFIPFVWLPVLRAGHVSDFQWGEFVVTGVLTAAGWVVADSYRGMRWLALRGR
jgi:uncharacterized membrane protein